MRYLLLLLLLVAVAGAAQAQQMYRWTDKNGKVQYGHTPPPGVAAKAVANRTGTDSSGGGAAASQAAPPASSQGRGTPRSLSPEEREAHDRTAEAKRAASRANR
jgi:hypothetical protein